MLHFHTNKNTFQQKNLYEPLYPLNLIHAIFHLNLKISALYQSLDGWRKESRPTNSSFPVGINNAQTLLFSIFLILSA